MGGKIKDNATWGDLSESIILGIWYITLYSISTLLFYLNTGIHLHKVKLSGLVIQEFNRSNSNIVDGSCSLNCCCTHLLSNLFG